LVRDHFASSVGPALTSPSGKLSSLPIESELPPAPSARLACVLEALRGRPRYWKKYYLGSAAEQAFKRQYSRSDRIRYY
jgi:D-tagatose-1,6-bisphosphate aldolase subunit GatZ/KbaZ